MLTPRSARCRQGQWTLIGTLVAVAIVIVLAALYLPRIVGRRAEPGGGAATPMQRADAVACMSYQSQINQAISMYKMDHDGAPPRTVDDIKNGKYGVTDEMLHAPGCNLVVPGGPGSGQMAAPNAPGGMPPPPAGSTRGPGGVAIPGSGTNAGDTGE
ncbi:MAG: type II secretion system GspH family protein [Armatimonadota bacterium]|nr:type II secretion system GspH family protein [Armatimonadota bacterium]